MLVRIRDMGTRALQYLLLICLMRICGMRSDLPFYKVMSASGGKSEKQGFGNLGGICCRAPAFQLDGAARL